MSIIINSIVGQTTNHFSERIDDHSGDHLYRYLRILDIEDRFTMISELITINKRYPQLTFRGSTCEIILLAWDTSIFIDISLEDFPPNRDKILAWVDSHLRDELFSPAEKLALIGNQE